jgi:hypothetical protein
MRKITIIPLLLVFACVSFKPKQKDYEPIIYLMPEIVEEMAIDHIKDMRKFKGDSISFYVSFGMYHSVDTFLLTIKSFHSSLNSNDKLYRLVHASNRFVKIGNMNVPVIYMEDYWYSSIVNKTNLDGGIERMIPSGKYYSIVFTGQSYEKGKVVWTGWAGG